jgi:hypothetical protein
MKVHPAMLMKTKEREQACAELARRPLKSRLKFDSREPTRRSCSQLGSWLRTPVLKMKVHPAMLMKTKEGRKDGAGCRRSGDPFGGLGRHATNMTWPTIWLASCSAREYLERPVELSPARVLHNLNEVQNP